MSKTDELRDEAARLLKWYPPNAVIAGRDRVCDYWLRHDGVEWLTPAHDDHPIPDTLDGIAALWREHLPGWEWWRFRLDDGNLIWEARVLGTTKRATLFDSGDELFDRLALFVAALKCERSGG